MRTEHSFLWKCLQYIAKPFALLFFNLKVYGREHVPDRGGVLLVSNHQSYLDPILLPLYLDRPMNFIAKSELFKNRAIAWFLSSVCNAFPVRQGRGDVHAVKETIQRLQEGHLMNIFPEGGRTENGEIGPLQGGVGLIVERARVVVVPAVVVGAFEAWPIQRKFPRRWPISIQYGPPLDLTGMERDEIIETIDRSLRTMFATLREKVASQQKMAA